MAFTNTPTEKKTLPGGLVMERGTWNGASVTTGTITAATGTVSGESSDIGEIYFSEICSDTDDVVKVAADVGPNKRKLTFTSSDTGTYTLVGRSAG